MPDVEASLQGVLVLSRALHFCATAVLLGGGGLLFLVMKSGAQAGRTGERLVRAAAALAIVSGLAWLAVTLAIITGDPSSLMRAEDWSAFWASAFGPPWMVHLVLLAGCGVLLASHRPWMPGAAAILAAGLAIDQAWLGHGATGSGSSGGFLLASHALHALAAYAWTGALPVLALLLLAKSPPTAAARALALFSTAGLAVVATILVTGATNAAFHMGAASALLTTLYGRILVVKLTLFAAMLLLAFLNRTAAARLGSTPSASRQLLLNVLLEGGIGALVLSAAALLGMTAPPP